MARLNILLIVVGVAALPFIQNAPSTIVKTPTNEELTSRVVFVDPDSEEPTKVSLPRSVEYAKSAQSVIEIKPIVGMKAPESSSLTKMDDERRIWGIAVENKEVEEDESFYNRPLNLHKTVTKFSNPIKKIVVNTEPKVETQTAITVPKPSECDFSIVICCGNLSTVKECFKSRGCINATDDMFPSLCSSESVNKVIRDLAKYYKGNQDKR